MNIGALNASIGTTNRAFIQVPHVLYYHFGEQGIFDQIRTPTP
jgi:hypothetical protein